MKKSMILIATVFMINLGGCGEPKEEKATPNSSASGQPEESPQPKTKMPDPDS